MIEVSKEQIIIYHEIIINNTGGANGLRDEGMLESALEAPIKHSVGKTFIHL